MRVDNLNSDQYNLNRSYNSAAIPSTGTQSGVRPDTTQQRRPEEETTPKKLQPAEQPVQKTSRGNASLGNVSIALGNRDDSLVGLGNIGGIQSNVMKKAVSQMQKDSVLHEYQYFVGSGVVNNATGRSADSNILTNDEDGIVIRKS